MLIDWTAEFDGWLNRQEDAAAKGSRIARLQLDYIDAQLEVLEELAAEPAEETAVLRRVRQSRKYPVWRVSHPFDPDVAVRLICWFPPTINTWLWRSLQATKPVWATSFTTASASARTPQSSGGKERWNEMVRGRGNERLQQMRSDPQRAARVAAIREGMQEMDRQYALNLAAIRKAAELTQAELAQRLGISQGSVSKIEGQRDWLLSTLANYIHAAGVENARIAVTVNGHDMEFALPNVHSQECSR